MHAFRSSAITAVGAMIFALATAANAQSNQLSNGDFSSGTSQWQCDTYNGASASCEVNAGEFTVNIVNDGNLAWHIQAKQGGLRLVSGRAYTFAFDAKADASRRSEIKVERDGSPYEDFSQTGTGQNLTRQMQRFVYTFTASSSLTNARVVINVGNSPANVAVDNVYLVEGRQDPCGGRVGCQVATPTATPTPTRAPTATPTPTPVPGAVEVHIEAEDYARFYDTSAGNNGGAYRQDNVDIQATSDNGGGYNVGWIALGEWLEYDRTINPGSYEVFARVASIRGGAFTLSAGGQSFNAEVPATAGWQAWQTISLGNIVLNSGATKVRVDMDANGFNINWFKFKPACNDASCRDSDNDGVTDALDQCPNTPAGVAVDDRGCEISAALSATEAAARMGKGVNLGQMFDNTQHAPTLANAKPKIDAYYARGFRNVRIPVTWTEDVSGITLANPNSGVIDRNLNRLAEIEAVVDYALSKPDMFVIINAHHEQGLKDGNKASVLAQLWQDISDIFKGRDERLVYEILNEPHLSGGGAMPPSNLRNMTGRAYDKIRAADPTRIIIIGGNQWFGASEMAATWPNLNQVGGGNDPYLMATFHHYDPWSFNGNDQGDYADNWNDGNIGNPMDIMQQWADTVGNGMPVYIGEWGTGWGSRYSQMQCNNIRLWYSKFIGDFASQKGMPTSVWDDGGWFMVFDHATNDFNNNLIDCMGGSCAWQGTSRFAGCD